MITKIANKKGISPLLATVLLVGVVIALSLIIWFWYGQIIKSQTEKSGIKSLQACAQDVDFKIKNLCKETLPGEEIIRFKVENSGIAIPRFKVTFTGPSGSVVNETSIGVSTATTQDITIGYSSNIGNLDKVQITPFIIAGEAAYCEDKTQEIEQIQTC